jgi:hypothetical protein
MVSNFILYKKEDCVSKKQEFKEVDKFLDWFKENRPATVYLVKNKKRYDEVMKAVEDITTFAVESNPKGTKIVVDPDELTGMSICFEIISNIVVFEDMKKFCEAAMKASNMDIHSRTDDKVSISFVFPNVFEPALPAKKN